LSKQLKPVIVLGAGGHAAVLIDILKQQKRKILAIVSPDNKERGLIFEGIKVFLQDDDVLSFEPESISLVNGVGSIPGNKLRENMYNHFIDKGYNFETIVSDDAVVSDYATLAGGVQVMAGAMVQVGAIINANSIINTCAIIDHDCEIGCHNHIAPGATLSGGVITGDGVHVGTGSNIIQLINIGINVVVGAGTTVTKNVEKNTICYPARIFKKVVSPYEL
jgi:sugar O-acyltransferase (sialic acid O-acetyltransferase NeuD family)